MARASPEEVIEEQEQHQDAGDRDRGSPSEEDEDVVQEGDAGDRGTRGSPMKKFKTQSAMFLGGIAKARGSPQRQVLLHDVVPEEFDRPDRSASCSNLGRDRDSRGSPPERRRRRPRTHRRADRRTNPECPQGSWGGIALRAPPPQVVVVVSGSGVSRRRSQSCHVSKMKGQDRQLTDPHSPSDISHHWTTSHKWNAAKRPQRRGLYRDFA